MATYTPHGHAHKQHKQHEGAWPVAKRWGRYQCLPDFDMNEAIQLRLDANGYPAGTSATWGMSYDRTLCESRLSVSAVLTTPLG